MNGSRDARPARWPYLLSGLLLLAPAYYFWAGLNPVWPPAWPEQALGPYSASVAPYDDGAPPRYDGAYVKDFGVHWCAGCENRIRMAYLSVGRTPIAATDALEGVVHGPVGGPGAHVHFPAWPPRADDRLWLTVEDWSGRVHYASWSLTAPAPKEAAP